MIGFAILSIIKMIIIKSILLSKTFKLIRNERSI